MVGALAPLFNEPNISLGIAGRHTSPLKLGDPGHAMLDRS